VCSNDAKVDATMTDNSASNILIYMKQNPKICDAFLDNLLSREQWASFLGFHRTTLWRWEEEIINAIPPLEASYYNSGRTARSNYLDSYQRFLSVFIFLLKSKEIGKGVKNNAEVKEFLKINFMHLRRKDFEKWRNDNVYS
jgi:hypothetical protein